MNIRTCVICKQEFEMNSKKLWDEKNKFGYQPICFNPECGKKKRQQAGFNMGVWINYEQRT
jgi:hypothetical protein